MKKQIFTLGGIFFTASLLAQTPATKIVLNKGQKIVVQTTVSIETNMAPGMDASSNSTSENILFVKEATDKNYTISNSLAKLKLNMEMMGKSNSYDSEKKQDQDTEIGKGLGEKLNKSSDVIIDKSTGNAIITKKPEAKKDVSEADPMQNMLQMFGDAGSDESIVSGAFEIIPQGKKPGDSWADTTTEKDKKTIRTYTFKSNADTGAVIRQNTVVVSASTMEMMGMSLEVNTTTQSNSDILLDIATGQVKRKSTESNVTGSFQMMGQDSPISAKATTVSIYKNNPG